MTETTERDLIAEVEELLAKATPGHWFWTVNLKAKQISLQSQDGPRQYVMDFVRYGMNGAQPRFNVEGLMQDAQDCAAIVEGREHHAAWYQTLDHPDAHLIARSPELLRRMVERDKRNRQALKLMVDLWDAEHPDDPCGCVGASDDCKYPPTCELCVARIVMEGRDPSAE